MVASIISVVTPVRDGGHEFLSDTYASLVSQELPDGWTWQWVVQEDGETGRPLRELPVDDRISPGTGRAGRAAMARTAALARVEGILIKALDADDMLADNAVLRRDIETLTAHPTAGWCVSACLDLHPDGTLVPGPFDPPPGPLPPGLLAEGYRRDELQVMATTMTAHTELIRLLGGWQALPALEVAALLLACEAIADGVMISEVSEIYRKHPGQSTAEPGYRDENEYATRYAVIFQRVEALRNTGWRWTPSWMTRLPLFSPIEDGQRAK